MRLLDLLTLAATTAAIAVVLLLEHYTSGKRHWPRQVYYAEGLVTVMGGLLLWAALTGTVSWLVAAALFLAGVLSGAPNFLLIGTEERRLESALRALERDNEQLAAQLRLLLAKLANSRYMHRIRDLVETAAFIEGSITQDRRDQLLAEGQARDILAMLSGIVGDKA